MPVIWGGDSFFSPIRLLARLLTIPKSKEGRGNNRSVMPLDALGRTRTTLVDSESTGRENKFFFFRLWDLKISLLDNIHRGWD